MRSNTIQHGLRSASAATLMTLTLLASGCGKSSTAPPVEPSAPPPPPLVSEYTDVTMRFESVYCIFDGDGALAGAGEFWFGAYAMNGSDSRLGTTGDRVPSNWIKLNDGETFLWGYSETFRIRNDDHAHLQFAVVAAEMDIDILNGSLVDADPDLDFANTTVTLPDDARLYNLGLIRQRLGNDNCRVEFQLRVTSRPVPAS